MLDALLARSAASPAAKRHALSFPGALDAAHCAAQKAAQAGFLVDSDWVQRFVFSMAFDRQDVFSRLIGRSLIIPQRLEVSGYWPEGKFMALGLHWGSGFPVLEHLMQCGRSPAFVYRPENPKELESQPRRIRNHLHMRVLNGFGECIRVGGAYEKIMAALESDRVPVALFDAPAEQSAQTLQVNLSGYQLTLRRGLLHLLATQKVPFVFYRCGLRPEGSYSLRVLSVSEVACSDDIEEIAAMAANFLLDALRHDAAQWHFWPGAESIISHRVQS